MNYMFINELLLIGFDVQMIYVIIIQDSLSKRSKDLLSFLLFQCIIFLGLSPNVVWTLILSPVYKNISIHFARRSERNNLLTLRTISILTHKRIETNITLQ